MESSPFTAFISEPLMSRSYASIGLACLIVAVPLLTGFFIALGMATPMPELAKNSATRENPGASKTEIIARLKRIVDQHNALGNKATDFQGQVAAAAEVLLDADKGITLEFNVPATGNQQILNQFKNNLTQVQMNVGLTMFKIDTALEELDGLTKQRAREPRPWQARYDYVRARLAAQVAFLYEYNAQLGQMRKETPALDPNKQTGWRLVPHDTFTDRDASKYARKAKNLLTALAKDHAGGDWELIAREEMTTVETGLQWTQLK
jgi:hypothetical protein